MAVYLAEPIADAIAYGSLFGRTYRGCDRGDIYGNPVCSAV